MLQHNALAWTRGWCVQHNWRTTGWLSGKMAWLPTLVEFGGTCVLQSFTWGMATWQTPGPRIPTSSLNMHTTTGFAGFDEQIPGGFTHVHDGAVCSTCVRQSCYITDLCNMAPWHHHDSVTAHARAARQLLIGDDRYGCARACQHCALGEFLGLHLALSLVSIISMIPCLCTRILLENSDGGRACITDCCEGQLKDTVY